MGEHGHRPSLAREQSGASWTCSSASGLEAVTSLSAVSGGSRETKGNSACPSHPNRSPNQQMHLVVHSETISVTQRYGEISQSCWGAGSWRSLCGGGGELTVETIAGEGIRPLQTSSPCQGASQVTFVSRRSDGFSLRGCPVNGEPVPSV